MKEEYKNQLLAILAAGCVILLALLIFLFVASGSRLNKLKQVERMYEISQDSLKTERNAKNEETAKVEVLEAENNQLFTSIKIKDKEVNRLQNLVTNYEKKIGNLNTAIIFSNETIVSLRDSIKSLIVGYTQDPDTPTIYYPIYERKFEREWSKGNIIMGFNELDVQLSIKNEYDITIGDEKVSLFKRKQYANITNLNPDTETKVMKVYDKKEKKDHTVRNAGIFTGIGLLVGLLIN